MVDCTNCCGALSNWARYGLQHRTLHMASDLKEGDVIYVGSSHHEYRVTEIKIPFRNITGTVLTASAVNVTEGEPASLEFIKKQDGSVVIKIVEEIRKWGIRGHSRNNHNPVAHKETVTQFL